MIATTFSGGCTVTVAVELVQPPGRAEVSCNTKPVADIGQVMVTTPADRVMDSVGYGTRTPGAR